MLEPLPESSFVPISAAKLARPILKWVNPAYAKSFRPLEHAYCQAAEGEPKGAYLPTTRLYDGERYGGGGIGPNSGGVRCGTDGRIQIKGIGRNALAGDGAELWHSHGGASLQEGIREAVWSEVCQVALPFGAARTLAIVDTGTRVPYLSLGGKTTARRALIMREPTLRPGHFMRATFAVPQKDMTQFPSDLIRTRLAVRQLPMAFRMTFNVTALGDGLLTMADRFAVQTAAGTAKRLMHGTLSASNTCLDGRWIDFGTASSLSDYGRVILGSNDTPDLWAQHTSLMTILEEMHFYCEKFSLPETLGGLIPVGELRRHFLTRSAERMEVEFLKLTGVPEEAILAVPKALRANLFACFQKILARGNSEPFKLAPTHVWKMPLKMGKFHLNSIVRVSAFGESRDQTAAALGTLLSDDTLRDEFVVAYWALREDFLAMFPRECQSAAKIGMIIAALRLNTAFTDLYRGRLDASIEELVLADGAIDSFVSTLCRKAEVLVLDPQGIDEVADQSVLEALAVEDRTRLNLSLCSLSH